MPILEDTAEATKGGIRARPCLEARLDGGDDCVQSREVLFMQAAAPHQFPNSLDRVELRAVGRQEVQTKVIHDFSPPGRVHVGMMITRIVDDDDYLASRLTTDALEFAQEIPASPRIEHAFGPRHHHFAVLEADRAEEADAFAGGGMKANWILHLGCNPQTATRAVLLEVHLIHRPQINLGVSSQATEFFYALSAARRRPIRGHKGRLGVTKAD